MASLQHLLKLVGVDRPGDEVQLSWFSLIWKKRRVELASKG
jgi:hypothetical protein